MSIIATVIVVAISLYFIFGYQPGDLFNRPVNDGGDGTRTVITGTIDVGTKVEAARNSVGTSGGTVTINKPGDALDGFQLEVPANSYDATRTFQVSYAPVKAHTFGQNFNPISPLISVENGGGYSDEVMLVKIPVHIPEGHFAMGFFYDSASGQLEGLPLVAEDEDSITVATRHFTDFIISSVRKEQIMLPVKSGFLPGYDDWQFPNEGSYLEPWGHCAGQSLTAMWYYDKKFLEGEKQLNGLYDNNDDKDTPEVWQDDTLAYRLASMVQEDYNKRWDKPLAVGMQNWASKWNDTEQMYNFAYAMQMTHRPQFVYVADTIYPEEGSHAMVVYEVVADGLRVADPNYRGSLDRKIKFENSRFVPYNSALNADAAKRGEGIEFNLIWWMSEKAIIDWSKIADRWSEMEKGTIGEEEFPDYTLLAIEQDGTEHELRDGFTTDKSILTIEAASSLILGTSIYQDNDWLRTDANGEPIVDTNSKVILQEGKNKLGIWVCARMVGANVTAYWTWLDFKWVTVTYTQTPTPTTSLDKVTIVDASIMASWVPSDLPVSEGDGSYVWEGSVTLDFGGISLPAGTWLTLKPKNFSDLEKEFYFIAYPYQGFNTIELQSTGPVYQVTFHFSATGTWYFQNVRPPCPELVVRGLYLAANPWGAAPPIPPEQIYEREFDIVITAASP
jgi:hypothetical protein